MKNFMYKLIALLSFALGSFAFAQESSRIIDARTGLEVKNFINGAIVGGSKANLFLMTFWDADDVLWENLDPSVRKTKLGGFLDKGEIRGSLMKKVIRSAKKKIVEPEIQEIIKELRSKGIPTFCLTKCSSDLSAIVWRKGHLEKFGYDFSSKDFKETRFQIPVSSPLKKSPYQTEATWPVFDNGVIFAGSAEKGEVLKGFIAEYLNVKSISSLEDFMIIFVDDELRNLELVKAVCEELGVREFLGIHFTAAEQSEHAQDASQWVADYKTHILKGTNEFLSDKGARLAFNICHGSIYGYCTNLRAKPCLGHVSVPEGV